MRAGGGRVPQCDDALGGRRLRGLAVGVPLVLLQVEALGVLGGGPVERDLLAGARVLRGALGDRCAVLVAQEDAGRELSRGRRLAWIPVDHEVGVDRGDGIELYGARSVG